MPLKAVLQEVAPAQLHFVGQLFHDLSESIKNLSATRSLLGATGPFLALWFDLQQNFRRLMVEQRRTGGPRQRWIPVAES